MNPRQAFLGILLAVSLAGCATTGPRSGEDDVRELEQLQARAAVSGDRAALERIFAPEFRLINPVGAIATRDELLAMLSGGTPPYRAASYVTDMVKPYGRVVVTTGTESVEFGAGAQAGTKQRRRITQVWERQGDAWRLVLRHATLVTATP
jgi:hypothetical protein